MIEPTDEMVAVFGGTGLWADGDEIRAALAAVLAIVERDQSGELADLRALFQLQWTRSREADARWRAEDPEARANVWPDLGVLLKWLMDDADRARDQLAAVERDRRPLAKPERPEMLSDRLGYPASVGDEDWQARCGKAIGEHMLCARPRDHGFPPCGIPVAGSDGELAS